MLPPSIAACAVKKRGIDDDVFHYTRGKHFSALEYWTFDITQSGTYAKPKKIADLNVDSTINDTNEDILDTIVTPGGIYGHYAYDKPGDEEYPFGHGGIARVAPGTDTFVPVPIVERHEKYDKGVKRYSYDRSKLYYDTIYEDEEITEGYMAHTTIFEADPDGSNPREVMRVDGYFYWVIYDGVIYWADEQILGNGKRDNKVKAFDLDTGEEATLFSAPIMKENKFGARDIQLICRAGGHLYIECMDLGPFTGPDDAYHVYYRMNLDGSDIRVLDETIPALVEFTG